LRRNDKKMNAVDKKKPSRIMKEFGTKRKKKEK
jgi:hypothetical protein